LLPFCISGPEPHERADEEEDEFDMVAKGAVVGLSSIFLDPFSPMSYSNEKDSI
jgi:hypothetical protein